MKIMVVFYSLHVCPWIPGERKCCPILVFLGNIFQENFEIQDGHQRVFSHIAISVGHAMEMKKTIITLMNFR
jgi:hypothetical protein